MKYPYDKWYWVNRNRMKQKEITKQPDWYGTLEQQYVQAAKQKAAAEERMSELRGQILESMQRDGLKKIGTDKMFIQLVKAYEGRKINQEKLKSENPALFEQYSTPYTMKEHLQITVKKEAKE